MTKIQFALLAAVLGMVTMGGAGYMAYASSSSHGPGGGSGAALGAGQPSGESSGGGSITLPTDGSSAGAGDTGGSGTGNGSGGAKPCQNGDVQVTESPGQGAAGHVSLLLVFQNTSGHPCTLHGYPGAALVAQDGSMLLNAKRTLSGSLGGAVGLKKAPVVQLAAGEQASAVLEWSDVEGDSACVTSAATLVVTPPDFTRNQALAFTAGTQVCSGFEIHPVLEGVVSEPADTAGN